jgi:hypothetical protein
VDADVIRAFISGMTNEALVHELRHSKPQMARELLNLTTSHASGEGLFVKSFASTRARPKPNPKKDSWRCHDSEFIVAVNRVHR